MAKLCTVCDHFYHDEFDSCPQCARAFNPLAQDSLEPAMMASKNLGGIGFEGIHLLEVDANSRERTVGEASPLTPLAKAADCGGIEVRESDFDQQNGDSPYEPNDQDPDTLAEGWTPPTPGSNTEFDLSVMMAEFNDGFHPIAGISQAIEPDLITKGLAEDFGVHLIEDKSHGPPHQASEANGSVAKTLGAAGGGRVIDSAPGPVAKQVDSASSIVGSSEEPDLELAREKAHPQIRKKERSELLAPHQTEPAVSQADETPQPATTLVVMSAAQNAALSPKKAWRLSGTAGGLILGMAVSLVFWLGGVEPPQNWRFLNSRANMEAAVLESGADPRVDKAFDLAREGRYQAAVETVNELAKEKSQIAAEAKSAGDKHFLTALSQLAVLWELQDRLHATAQGTKSNAAPVPILDGLLAKQKDLQEKVDAVSVKLNRQPSAVTKETLVHDLDELQKARELAGKQSSVLRAAREETARAEQLAKTSTSQAQKLERDLHNLQIDVAKTKAELQIATAVQKEPPVAKTTSPSSEILSAPNPQSAFERYTSGRSAFGDLKMEKAEQEFALATKLDDQDARYHYFLGVSRWSLGKEELAKASFRHAASLEKQNKPSKVFVGLALEALSEENRRIVDEYRSENR